MSIDVVIPTYRGAARVASCLTALDTSGLPDGTRVLVVDDGSGDGTAETVRTAHDVEVLARAENGGFAQAADAGLRHGEAPVVVLLNDDVEVEPGFLAAITAPLADDLRCGAVAPLLLRADGDEVEGVGLEADRALSGYSRGWGLRRADATTLAGAAALGPLGPSGGAAAYRRRALEDVGYLDLGIHAYNEDLDLALRLRAAGWSCATAVDAVAVHLGGATFGARSERQLWAKGHSRGYLLRKYGVLRRPRSAAEAFLHETSTVAFQLLKDRSAAGLRGRVDGWRDGRGAHAAVPVEALDPSITFTEAVRRRRAYGG